MLELSTSEISDLGLLFIERIASRGYNPENFILQCSPEKALGQRHDAYTGSWKPVGIHSSSNGHGGMGVINRIHYKYRW